jgi:Flagellar basal body protein FlaE
MRGMKNFLAPATLIVAMGLTAGCITVNVLPADDDSATTAPPAESDAGLHCDSSPRIDASAEAGSRDDVREADAPEASSPVDACSVRATTVVSLRANLNSSDTSPELPWDSNNGPQTSNFSTGVQVYASSGDPFTITLYFRESSLGSWTYYAVANGEDVTASSTDLVVIGIGALSFDDTGAMVSNELVVGTTVTFNGALPQTITYDLGTPISAGGSGTDGVTQFSAPDSVSAESQNGQGVCGADGAGP